MNSLRNLQLVKILSDAGADFGLKDSGGNTPADSADKCKENEIAEFLRVGCAIFSSIYKLIKYFNSLKFV